MSALLLILRLRRMISPVLIYPLARLARFVQVQLSVCHVLPGAQVTWLKRVRAEGAAAEGGGHREKERARHW